MTDCHLLHICCSACGHEIHEDGACGCADNRQPGPGIQQGTIGRLRDEVEQLRARSSRQTDYAVALQRAIEYHCRNMPTPRRIAVQCPHYAGKLDTYREAAGMF